MLLFCLPGDRGVYFVFPPEWRGTSSTLESRLGLRTKCIKMWRLCIYLNRVPTWLASIQHDLMKVVKLLRDGLVLGRIGEAKSDGGGFSNGENTWTPPSLTSLIYLFLLGDFNLPEVPFPDHWCEVSPLPEAPVGSPVIIGRCCFCYFCYQRTVLFFLFFFVIIDIHKEFYWFARYWIECIDA